MTEEGVLPFPVLAANDARMKHLFDNRYGTGHSSMVSLLSNTNLFLSGKTVVVMGYGWVGRGLAKYAKGMGARVVVCEPEPVKDRKSTRLNSSHANISYAVFCLKK